MIAIDTNVLVRLLVRDDERQFERARDVFASGKLAVSKTVLLETSWVLLHCYGVARDDVHRALEKLLGYPQLTVEDRPSVLFALSWHAAGMDFADALHLATHRRADAFVTFDRKLGAAARLAEGSPRVRLLRVR